MSALSKAETEPVLLRRDEDGIAVLTLNRPQARNALSVALMARLQDSIDAIAGDAAVRVVVNRRRRPRLLRRSRSARDPRQSRTGELRGAVQSMQPG